MIMRRDIYDTYWHFAFERQEIFFKKLKNSSIPYTLDSILGTYKFCNVYRASDRVSQFLIREVIYNRNISPKDTLFRIFLFRLLNNDKTWAVLEQKLGEVSIENFSFDLYDRVLSEISKTMSIYGNAFILCANKTFGYNRKHQNHLALLEQVFLKNNVASKLLASKNLEELFLNLLKLPLIGNFMAYQLAIDFNYSEVFDFNEDDFTIAGPGAIRGIRKCFIDTEGKNNTYIINYMVDNQEKEFQRLGLNFKTLWGRRLHAIDCQGLFCETDKYCRAKFPELKSNRSEIKSRYKPRSEEFSLFYPPKWGLNSKILTMSEN